jgi:tRNA(Ile)-lysidine synthase
MNTMYNCIVCGAPLSGKQRSFCSVKCKNNHFLGYDALKARAQIRKRKLIAIRGGACNSCGYSENIGVLSFYNADGESLHIDTTLLANSNYEKLVNKVREARLLCRNCYEANHNPNSLVATIQNVESDVASRHEAKFARNILQCGVKSGQTLVLGISGGIDSMVMLDLFANTKLKLKIIVAHVDHNSRPTSTHDESFVRKQAKKHGYTYYSHILEDLRIVGNLEEHFRDERRKFLLDTAVGNSATYVVLAHNANDQAETFIMNAVRGSGPAGLGAMSLAENKLIRPMLNFSRSEIEEYAVSQGIEWHEDETNKDTNFSRNYIRHRLLPLFERLNPEYLSALGRTTTLQRQIDEHFKEEAYRLMQNPSVKSLVSLDKPLLYEVLGLMYEEVRGDRQNLSLTHLVAIESLITTGGGTRTLDLPENITVKRSYDKLDFSSKKAHNTASTTSTKKLTLGVQKFDGWKVTVSSVIPAKAGIQGLVTTGLDSRLRGNDKVEASKDKYSIPVNAADLPNLLLRTRRTGDRIASIGPKGTKKLQDLFVDAKIDKHKRDAWPVLENTVTKEVIWIPGLAKAHYKATNQKLLTINIVEDAHETN